MYFNFKSLCYKKYHCFKITLCFILTEVIIRKQTLESCDTLRNNLFDNIKKLSGKWKCWLTAHNFSKKVCLQEHFLRYFLKLSQTLPSKIMWATVNWFFKFQGFLSTFSPSTYHRPIQNPDKYLQWSASQN